MYHHRTLLLDHYRVNSDTAQPLPRASYGGADGPLAVVGDLIYAAGEDGGLQALRVHPDRFPAPAFLPLVSH
jgi:hypothetical protein